MIQDFIIKTYVDGGDGDTIFIDADNPIEVGQYTYTAQRMGAVPSITATIYSFTCLDSYWTKKQYITCNGEKYFVFNNPSSAKKQDDGRYSHSVTFYSERYELNGIYFFDVVESDSSLAGGYFTNSTTVNTFCDIHEFAERLQMSLNYCDVDYTVEVDDNIESETVAVSFEDTYILTVLQDSFELFDIPHYFVGKEIHFGYAQINLTQVFEQGDSLLEINKTNTNAKEVTYCSGYGSENNIPYYYPNVRDVYADQIKIPITVENDLDSTCEELGIKQYTDETTTTVLPLNDLKMAAGELSFDYFDISYEDAASGNIETEQTLTLSAGTISVSSSSLVQTTITTSVNVDFFPIFNITDEDVVIMLHLDPVTDGGDPIPSVFTLYDEFSSSVPTVTWDVRTPSTDTSYNVSLIVSPAYYTPSQTDGTISTTASMILPFSFDVKMEGNTTYYESYNFDIDTVVEYIEDTLIPNNPTYSTELNALLVRTKAHVEDYNTVSVRLPYVSQLMPSIFRDTDGAERFYPAENKDVNDSTKGYLLPDGSGDYYTFTNTYDDSIIKEQVVQEFEDIYPTIEGVTNADGDLIGQILALEYDDDDNDLLVYDENGEATTEYQHPYFYIKLRKFDGDDGFNLFDYASTDDNMTIVMTDGNLNGAEFEIVTVAEEVDGEYKFWNPVQVNSNGDISSGNSDNKVDTSNLQERQRDTNNYQVWLAVKKNTDTFNTLLPSVDYNVYANSGDSFVITNISLPHAYVTAAEDRLTEAIIAYMAENNVAKYTFTIKFSRVFLAENPSVLAEINENSALSFIYDGVTYNSYISTFSYKSATESDPLPEITVTLSEELSANTGALQNAISEAKTDILSSIYSSADIVKLGLPYFLRKDVADTASASIKFKAGAFSDNFRSGALAGAGWGAYTKEDGTSVGEFDEIYVRKTATFNELVINQISFTLGQTVFTNGGCELTSVEDVEVIDEDTNVDNGWYRCYYDNKDGKRMAGIVVGDYVRCQEYDESYASVTRFYSRLVVSVGSDYVDLSKEVFNGVGIPQIGDNCVQWGNYEDTDRQYAIIRNVTAGGYDQFLWGINTVSSVGTEYYFVGVQTGFDPRAQFGNENIGGYQFVLGKDDDGSPKVTGKMWLDSLNILSPTGVYEDTSDLITQAQTDATTAINNAAAAPIIAQYDSITTEYENITAQKEALTTNDYLTGTTILSSVVTNYTSYTTATTTILDSISDIKTNGYTSEKETLYNGKLTAYNTALSQMTASIVAAQTYVTDTIAAEAQAAANAAAQASSDLSDYETIANERLSLLDSALSDAQTQIGNLQTQSDGLVQGHTGTDVPTLSNSPAVDWDTDELLKVHENDIYNRIETVDGVTTVIDSYKFIVVNGVYQWALQGSSESAATTVLATAAYALAGTKAQIFYSNTPPVPLTSPYNVNDVWIDLDDMTIYMASTANSTNSTSVSSDWFMVNDSQLKISNMASDNVISESEKLDYRDLADQMYSEMQTYASDAVTYGVSDADLQSAYSAVISSYQNTYKIYDSGDTSITDAQRSTHNALVASYYSERTTFANAIAASITDSVVDSLQITTNNLLDNSNNTSFTGSAYLQTETFDGNLVFGYDRTATTSGYSDIAVVTLDTVKANTTYTYSLWAKGTSMTLFFTDPSTTVKTVGSDGQVEIFGDGAISFTLTSEWKQYWVKWTEGDVEPSSKAIYCGRVYYGQSAYITKPMLVEGSVVASWSPSYNDIKGVSIESSDVEYAQSNSSIEAPTDDTDWDTDAPTWVSGMYIWQRIRTTYIDGTTYTANAICITGEKGATGTSVSIDDTTVTYAQSTSGTQTPTSWSDTIPTMTAGNYLWTKTVVDYSTGDDTTSYSVTRWGVDGATGADGADGQDGTNGADGADGESITISSTSIMYNRHTSGTVTPTDTWDTAIPEVAEGEYLWTRTIVTYSDGVSTTAYSVSRQGVDGVGTNGRGIESITNYYLATSLTSGVTTTTNGWTTGVQTATATAPFLWNYEKITFDDSTYSDTTPSIIGNYSSDGADGKGISSIEEWYAINNSTTAPTSGFSTSVATPTSTNRYLWNYEVINYTTGDHTTTSKRIIGVYGDTGDSGLSISSIVEEYAISLYKSSDEFPSNYELSWSTTQPTWVSGYYLWYRSTVTYDDGTTAIVGTSVDTAWEAANDVQTNLDSLTFSSTNLLDYTTSSGNSYWSMSSGTITITDGVIRGTSNGSGWPRIANTSTRNITFDTSSKYTLSYWARADSEVTRSMGGIMTEASTDRISSDVSRDLTTEWQYFTQTFTPYIATSSAGRLQFYCGEVAGTTTSGTWTEIKEVMLVKGDKVDSSWSESANDTQTKLNEAAQAGVDAQDAVDVLNSDSWFSQVEKNAIQPSWYAISGNNDTVSYSNANGSYYNVYNNSSLTDSTKKTALNSAFDTLKAFLNTSGLYTSGATAVTASSFKTNLSSYFSNYYAAETAALQWIYDNYTDTAIADIEIGGVNLLDGSASGVDWNSIGTWDILDGVFSITTPSTVSERLLYTPYLAPLEVGATYTLSFWAKDDADTSYWNNLYIISNAYSTNSALVVKGYTPTNEWTYYTLQFVITSAFEGLTDVRVRFDNDIGTDSNRTGCTLYIKEPQLEKGNIATSYSKSTNDILYDALQASLSQSEEVALKSKWMAISGIAATDSTANYSEASSAGGSFDVAYADALETNVSVAYLSAYEDLSGSDITGDDSSLYKPWIVSTSNRWMTNTSLPGGGGRGGVRLTVNSTFGATLNFTLKATGTCKVVVASVSPASGSGTLLVNESGTINVTNGSNFYTPHVADYDEYYDPDGGYFENYTTFTFSESVTAGTRTIDVWVYDAEQYREEDGYSGAELSFTWGEGTTISTRLSDAYTALQAQLQAIGLYGSATVSYDADVVQGYFNTYYAIETVAKKQAVTSDTMGEVSTEIAGSIGYSSWDDMVNSAEEGDTLIKGGYINADLIDVNTLAVSKVKNKYIEITESNYNDYFTANASGSGYTFRIAADSDYFHYIISYIPTSWSSVTFPFFDETLIGMHISIFNAMSSNLQIAGVVSNLDPLTQLSSTISQGQLVELTGVKAVGSHSSFINKWMVTNSLPGITDMNYE